MSLLGLPTKELKATVEHADRTLTAVDALLPDARTTLRHCAGIAEDVHAITTMLRLALTREG